MSSGHPPKHAKSAPKPSGHLRIIRLAAQSEKLAPLSQEKLLMGLPQGKILPGATRVYFCNDSNLHPIRTIIAALLCCVALGGGPAQAQKPPADSSKTAYQMARTDDAKLKEWQAIWEKDIVSDAQNRYCDTAMGEDIGWLMYPFLQGFYYGYMATDDTEWIDREIDCADSWIKRAVIEPDGYPGWPKVGASGTRVDHFDQLYCDSLLGEAMVMRPIVLLSKKILETPALTGKYGAKAESYIKLSEQLYEKWDKRGAWREIRRWRHDQHRCPLRHRPDDWKVDGRIRNEECAHQRLFASGQQSQSDRQLAPGHV